MVEPSVTRSPATSLDAVELAAVMREDDRREIAAGSGRTPLDATLDSIQRSKEAWAVRVDGQLLAVWGVGGQRCAGVVWILTSTLVDRYPMLFWRLCRETLRELLERWPCLMNAIDARYERAVRFVRRLGALTCVPSPIAGAATDLPFVRFVITKEVARV